MSVENFKSFMQKVDQDDAVREKVKSFDQTDTPAMIAYAATIGFEFTAEDMLAVAREAGINPEDVELSEEQLEQVAGGATPAAITIPLATATIGITGAVTAATAKKLTEVVIKKSKW